LSLSSNQRAAGEKGILEQSDITLVSESDCSLGPEEREQVAGRPINTPISGSIDDLGDLKVLMGLPSSLRTQHCYRVTTRYTRLHTRRVPVGVSRRPSRGSA